MNEVRSAGVVISRANAHVKQLRAAFAGNARLSSGLIGIEGEHLVQEALTSGLVLKTIFLSERLIPPSYLPRGVQVIRLAEDVLRSCVETQTPQGIAALLVPPVETVEQMLRGIPLILIAAGLQDPGNLGTLVRSAEAFGASGVLTTPGTVSVWNQKSIRASAGSIFRMPIAVASSAVMETLALHGVQIFAAVKDGAATIDEVNLTSASAILIGNEGAGLGQAWLAQSTARVTIPYPGRVESLNAAVAGSLLLYEASRQRFQARTPR